MQKEEFIKNARLAIKNFGHINAEYIPLEYMLIKSGASLSSIEIGLRTKELCLIAVSKNGLELRNVQVDHRSLAICIKAVKNNSQALKYVPQDIMEKHPEIALEALKKDIFTLIYIDKNILTKNLEMCNTALQEFIEILDRGMINTINNNSNEVQFNIAQLVNLLKFLPEEFLDNKDVLKSRLKILSETRTLYDDTSSYIKELLQLSNEVIDEDYEVVEVVGDSEF